MPQLEMSTYATQIFWVLLTFICFWLVMDRLIIPRIADMVEARKRKYDDYILKAEQMNKKALASLQRYEGALAAAKAGAAEQIKQSEDELKAMIAEKENIINLELKKTIADNEAKLNHDKVESIAKIEEISKIAAQTVALRLGLDISAADIDKVSEGKGK